MMSTLTLSGRAIGPATAMAANSIVARVVSCMVAIVGLWVSCSFGELFESRTMLDVEIYIDEVGSDVGSFM
jgi:hypothetical protein